MKRSLPVTRRALYTAGGIVALAALWQALAIIVDRPVIVPAPAETLGLLWGYLRSPEVLLAAWQTAWKVLAALAAVIVVGLPLGLALGLSGGAYHAMRPAIMAMQAVPVVSWLTLIVFVWGIGWKGPLFIAVVALLPMAALTTVSGVHALDRDLLEVAHLYHVPRGRVLRDVYLGSLLPFIAAVLDVSVGQAWKVILVAEYLCGGSGLGVRILMARMNVDAAATWALTLLAVLLGLASERMIKRLTARVTRPWTTV